MADNGIAVASWMCIWVHGKIPWTEQGALNFRSRSLKLTVAQWDAVTVYCTGIRNISLDQRQKVKKWSKENCTLGILLYDLFGVISITALLLCFCFSFLFSLSLWLPRYFFPRFQHFILTGLVLSFLFSDYFFPPSPSDHFIIELSCIFLSFWCLLPESALPSCLPLGQGCCCCLISVLRFTGAALGCTDLVPHGHSAFVRRV